MPMVVQPKQRRIRWQTVTKITDMRNHYLVRKLETSYLLSFAKTPTGNPSSRASPLSSKMPALEYQATMPCRRNAEGGCEPFSISHTTFLKGCKTAIRTRLGFCPSTSRSPVQEELPPDVSGKDLALPYGRSSSVTLTCEERILVKDCLNDRPNVVRLPPVCWDDRR